MAKSNIKSNIKTVITKLKLASNVSTDKELAIVLKVDRTNLSSWKNQSKQIPIDYLIDFCNEYEVSLDYILRDMNEIEVSEDEYKIPYHDNYDFTRQKSFIIIKKHERIKKIYKNLRAVVVLSSEMPKSAPRFSTMLLDFDDTKVKETPQIFLLQANNNFFLREVSITPQLNYFLSSENTKIQSLTVEFDQVEVLAKLTGVIKWQE